MHEFMRVVAVINTVDDNVVYVEHQVAVGLFKHGEQKLNFAHRSVYW